MPNGPLNNKETWPRVPLGKLCNLVNGDAYRDTDWSTSGVPIIRIQNLNNAEKPFNYWQGSLEDRVQVKDGDVLLAWSGTPGTSFGTHLWQRGPGILNQHIFRVDLDINRLDPQWAVFAINERLESMIGSASGAVGLRHVRRGEVEALPILLPPITEQRRITRKLCERLAEAKRARTAVAAQLQAAEALPAAFLRAVFSTAAAREWPRQPLAECCDLLPSKSIALAADTEVQAITSACLTEWGFQASGTKPARMWEDDAKKALAQAGEILVARSNTPELVGRAALFSGSAIPLVASDLTIRLWPRETITGHFLSAFLSSLFVAGHWKDRAGGASGTMKKITRNQIENLSVPCPSPSEQQAIAARLQSEFEQAQSLREHLAQKLAAVEKLPAALLREAFKCA